MPKIGQIIKQNATVALPHDKKEIYKIWKTSNGVYQNLIHSVFADTVS